MPLPRAFCSFLLLALFAAACTSRAIPPQSTPGAPAAAAAVEKFFQLVEAKDYNEMGYVFGTADGPFMSQRDPGDAERQMYLIATILEHESFTLASERPVPGRLGRAVAFTVDMTQQGRAYSVPVVAVLGDGSRWYVERVDLEAVTGKM